MSALSYANSLTLYRRGLELIPGASQTISKRPNQFAFGAFPIYLERGKGARVWDVDGNSYIDYILALGPVTLGYAHEAVDAAVHAQIDRGVLFGLMHPVEVEAARTVIDAIPCAEQVRFFKTGAETTSAAVRVARAFTGRDIILHCGYHGWLDSVGATAPQPGVPDAFRGVLQEFEWQDVEAAKVLFKQHQENVAGVLVNPVSYFEVGDASFLKQLRELCDAHGALLMFDEIVTGYRLANGGAQEYFGVLPDLSCFAKGIANGYPVAALCGRREVMQAMNDALISSTYGGEAVSLAALVACRREYERVNVPEYLARQGMRLMDALNDAARRTKVKARWIGYPAMSAFEFGYPDSDLNRHCMTFWLQECAKRGVLFRRGGLNFISLAHDDTIIDETIEVGNEALRIMAGAIESGELESRLETQADVKGRYER